jgi:hypothetical protein
MGGGDQNEFGNGNALRRGLNPRITEPVDNSAHDELEYV